MLSQFASFDNLRHMRLVQADACSIYQQDSSTPRLFASTAMHLHMNSIETKSSSGLIPGTNHTI